MSGHVSPQWFARLKWQLKRRFCILWWPGQINKPHVQRKPNGITGTKWYFLKSWNLPIESLMQKPTCFFLSHSSWMVQLTGIPYLWSHPTVTVLHAKTVCFFWGGWEGRLDGFEMDGSMHLTTQTNKENHQLIQGSIRVPFKTSVVTRTPSWILLKGSPENSNSIQCCLHLAEIGYVLYLMREL